MTDDREARRVRAQILAADDAGQRPTVGGRRVSRAWPGEVWLCWTDTRGLVRLGDLAVVVGRRAESFTVQEGAWAR